MNQEIFEIASDIPDPAGFNVVGRQSSLNIGKPHLRPLIKWNDQILTLDLYMLPDEPMYVVLYCPLCARNYKSPPALRISQENKKIDLDITREPKFPGIDMEAMKRDLGREEIKGIISIEAFRCTWEEEPELRRSWLSICPWSVVVDNNVCRSV